MTDYYVDSNSGSNGDTGLTQALAWATIEYAVESGSLVAGDKVWIRRTHAEYSGAPTSDIIMAYTGTKGSFIELIGWPRAAIANTVITSATWVNGSTTVDLVVGATLSRTAHCGRWVTAPNGKKFLITRITDANTLIIDREYSGTGVSGTDGKFQIEADEDYSARPADVDGWDSDAIALPLVDFQDANYLFSGKEFTAVKNIEFRDSIDFATLWINGSIIQGCLLVSSNNTGLFVGNYNYFNRCIFEGSGTGSSQYGVSTGGSHIQNCAVYNFGGEGIQLAQQNSLENVNIGVEQVNAVSDIYVLNGCAAYGRDVKLGSTTKFTYGPSYFADNRGLTKISFENYQKVLGDHMATTNTQTFISKDIIAGSGDPYKRSGGADKILEVNCQNSNGVSAPERAVIIFEHEFETDTTSKSYRYYVNCKALSLTASELWLEVEYVDSYDDTSEYTITRAESDETCALRGSVSDWTQYIEVTGIAPAVASKVRIKCFVAKYDADGYIYIDPLPVVT